MWRFFALLLRSFQRQPGAQEQCRGVCRHPQLQGCPCHPSPLRQLKQPSPSAFVSRTNTCVTTLWVPAFFLHPLFYSLQPPTTHSPTIPNFQVFQEHAAFPVPLAALGKARLRQAGSSCKQPGVLMSRKISQPSKCLSVGMHNVLGISKATEPSPRQFSQSYC